MLRFSAPLSHVCVRPLPWVPPQSALPGWGRFDRAVALVSDGGRQGRYSYLMAEPDAVATLDANDPTDALGFLSQATAFATELQRRDLAPFTGGLIGIAGFEFGMRLEAMGRRPFRIEGRIAWPDVMLMRFAAVLAFDHQTQTVAAIGRGVTPEEAEAARERLVGHWEAAKGATLETPLEAPLGEGHLQSETPDRVHEDKVAALIGQIHAGDLFQANLARGWTGRLRDGIDPARLLAALSAHGPAPFGAMFRLDGRAVVSNSPERFIRLDGDRLETRPIKGTRPRGATPDDDRALAAELSASLKDQAENLMIVDLMRHDLSKVAEIGSVAVTALNALESYTNVHHLVSAVTARLRKGLTAADVLAATLPPGSVSGAPKVQAMKVIHAMEAARGPYCGALFAIDASGSMDSSVLIRTLALETDPDKRWDFRVAAGGGIVADSDPQAERIETETKLSLIKAVLEEG